MESIAGSPIPEGFCQCGCGQRTGIARQSRGDTVAGQPSRYIKGHYNKRAGLTEAQAINANPSGICACGCGQPTEIAPYNRPDRGYVTGQPLKWRKGHGSRRRIAKPPPDVDPNPSGLCLCGCGKPAPVVRQTDTGRGLRKGHHRRYLPNHHPHRRGTFGPRLHVRRDAAERFWEKVEKSDGCWVWKGGTCTGGYGVFKFEGKQQTAHRVAWQLVNGPIPPGLEVCHDCDKNYPVGDRTYRLCVRPTDLFLGTRKENMEDMARKGRSGPRMRSRS